jgi:hypothetical protein
VKPCYVKPFKELGIIFNFYLFKKNLNAFDFGLKSVKKKNMLLIEGFLIVSKTK